MRKLKTLYAKHKYVSWQYGYSNGTVQRKDGWYYVWDRQIVKDTAPRKAVLAELQRRGVPESVAQEIMR